MAAIQRAIERHEPLLNQPGLRAVKLFVRFPDGKPHATISLDFGEEKPQ
jgi:hypothetical protein